MHAGVDLISGVSCKSPYEWVDQTAQEWNFNSNGSPRETFRVSIYHDLFAPLPFPLLTVC